MTQQGGRKTPTPKTSFGQRLAAIKEEREKGGGKSVGELLTEAQEGILYSGEFIRAIRGGNALGIAFLRNTLGYAAQKAIREWHQRSWDEWKSTIRSLAIEGEGGEVPRRILDTIQTFEENPLLAQTLGTVIAEVGRPSQFLFSEFQFSEFLRDLIFKNLAMESETRPGRRAFEWRGKWYYPASLNKARVAWPFVVSALGRVRKYLEIKEEVLPRIQSLLEQASMESDPEEQNLHRLLLHVQEVGSMVVFDPSSRIGEEEAGLLAVLLGRLSPGSSTLLLMDSVADRPLPEFMQGKVYELPSLTVQERLDGGLEIGFKLTERVPEDEFAALMRVQRLIRRWIGQEGKFRVPALAEPDKPKGKKRTNR